MTTLRTLTDAVLERLGDVDQTVWSRAEVTGHLQDAYRQLATARPVFYDWTYVENLPRAFSYTQPWEKALLEAMGGFDAGCANFTAEVDRQALSDGRDRRGPANHTSPFEATDGWLASVGASPDISATADLPKTLTAIARVTWDLRGVDALEPRRLSHQDARYEVTKGEVYGYTWQKDGVRTLRKVRVPSAQASTAVVTGSWGLLRRPTDLTTDTVSGSWGVPRRVAGHHPIGTELFGVPRRAYLETLNVRVEHYRQGRALVAASDVCELPDRYAVYLRDYAQGKCLERDGSGHDAALAAHFLQRWARGLARVDRRVLGMQSETVRVLGGDGRPSVARPPRPQRPWPYGSVVR